MPDPFTDGDGEIERAEHISPRKTGDNIQAKRVAPYVWDGANWQRMVQPGEAAVKKTLIDKTTTTDVIYIGKADSGTATSDNVWKITKIDKTVTDNVTITYGAAGAYTNVWDNRATSVVYS